MPYFLLAVVTKTEQSSLIFRENWSYIFTTCLLEGNESSQWIVFRCFLKLYRTNCCSYESMTGTHKYFIVFHANSIAYMNSDVLSCFFKNFYTFIRKKIVSEIKKRQKHSELNTNPNYMLSIFFCRMCWRPFLACNLANINFIYVQFNAHQVKHSKRMRTNENVNFLAIQSTVHNFFCTPHHCNGFTPSEI